MTINAMPAQTMAQALVPIENSLIRNVGLAILGSLALWVSAKISIPFWPVPLTLQTLVVLVVGVAVGGRGDGRLDRQARRRRPRRRRA